MKPIVIVGSINMDLVSSVERAPGPGETVVGRDFHLHSGGKGANQAVAVARLGYPAVLLGKIGDDLFGSQLLETLKGYGVNTDEIETITGSSGTASIVVNRKGENSIIVTPAANLSVTPEYIESKLHVLRQAGMILAQLEIPLETVHRLAHICEELSIPLMLDPAPAQRLDAVTLSRINWFTPNQTEAQFYAEGTYASEYVLERFFQFGVRNVVLKKGSAGALIASADGARHPVEAFSVDVVDTTAAGDAFNGAFAVAVMLGWDATLCGRYAAAAAAISVTRKGAQPSLPSEREVYSFLAERHIEITQ